MKAPKEGSRKADVYAVFIAKGINEAIKKAVSLGLKAGTVKSWAGGWARGVVVPRVKQGAAQGAPAKMHDAFSPWFKHASRAAAIRDIMNICRRTGCNDKAFHVIERDGKFAVVPVSYEPKGPPPSFAKGDVVFDTTIPDKQYTVVTPGPEVSEVDAGEGVRNVPNYYLVKIEGVDVPAKAPAKKKAKAKAPAKAPTKAPVKAKGKTATATKKVATKKGKAK